MAEKGKWHARATRGVGGPTQVARRNVRALFAMVAPLCCSSGSMHQFICSSGTPTRYLHQLGGGRLFPGTSPFRGDLVKGPDQLKKSLNLSICLFRSFASSLFVPHTLSKTREVRHTSAASCVFKTTQNPSSASSESTFCSVPTCPSDHDRVRPSQSRQGCVAPEHWPISCRPPNFNIAQRQYGLNSTRART